jgi:hypothetical protein
MDTKFHTVLLFATTAALLSAAIAYPAAQPQLRVLGFARLLRDRQENLQGKLDAGKRRARGGEPFFSLDNSVCCHLLHTLKKMKFQTATGEEGSNGIRRTHSKWHSD